VQGRVRKPRTAMYVRHRFYDDLVMNKVHKGRAGVHHSNIDDIAICLVGILDTDITDRLDQ
jgi:hypothetical protein